MNVKLYNIKLYVNEYLVVSSWSCFGTIVYQLGKILQHLMFDLICLCATYLTLVVHLILFSSHQFDEYADEYL